MDLPIQLIVKVQQFEDKRIEAKASWNIKELKGKLSEIYPTSTEEQKLIYSGKLLNDTVVLKDVLREYEGQEAHTVHLVFTPKSGRNHSKFDTQSARQSSILNSNSQSTTPMADMTTNELRQRNVSSSTTPSSNLNQDQQNPNLMNIPSNYLNAFYGSASGQNDTNSQILAQQYAMQTWMQQAYAQYMNQYMNLLSSPEAFYQQQQQQSHQQYPHNFTFLPPQMPFVTPSTILNEASSSQQPSNDNEASTTAAAAAAAQQQQQPQQPAAEAPQRRFPNIIQDEQENRDWLDILYSMSRLMILLCLVYFYSSPIRCLVVILIGISIYLYHIYKQNQTRLNNNNSTRVNLNVNRPVPVQQPAAEVEGQENAGNDERTETDGGSSENSSVQQRQGDNEAESMMNSNHEATAAQPEPQVPVLTIVRTFVLSFFSSIIPEAPAL
ncbi:CLUMA_CG014262, isoform A [Clunio marinus]|uniref:CLUMA_CG014262, isoform A n=1 Tax=Clunio marinus TaxID=568069 RepID=A0A1J1IMK8_9DIPT|nr:CLUMA_CG014262, isoform A [Clunio marinus]